MISAAATALHPAGTGEIAPGHAQPLPGRNEFIFSLVLDNQL
jgi:hypothetical protein